MNTNNTTINAVLRAATPTTFAEYQKWLKQWREVVFLITSSLQ